LQNISLEPVSQSAWLADLSLSLLPKHFYLFDSPSFGNASVHPLLTITAVPEPTSIALGLVALSFLARRNRCRLN